MRKIFVLLSIILNIVLCDFVMADDSFTVYQYKFPDDYSKEVLKYLSFAENQIFNKIYSKDNLEDRLERLELQVYGAIQGGKLLTRINNLKNDITNVSQGGRGLQYAYKLFDLAGNGTISDNNYNFNNNTYNKSYSCRLPALKQYRSSRIEYNNYGSYNNFNPYINHPTDFSIGTGIKILNDD